MDYFKVVKKSRNLQIATTHVLTHALLLVEHHVLLLAVVVVQIRVKECVLVVHHALVETSVLVRANLDAEMLALIPAKLDAQEHVVRNAEMIVGVHAQLVVIMDALVAIGINNEFNYKENRILAVRLSEKHHLHRHKGLPVGLQILLPCGKEREGTDALGGGQDLHRLCARP